MMFEEEALIRKNWEGTCEDRDFLLKIIDKLREKLAVAEIAICKLLDIDQSEDEYEDIQFSKEALARIRDEK